MKKNLLLFFSLFSAALLHAQTPEDALRFSWNVQGGTARVQAIGGAMGSLGGDITATFVNPAGLGFYRTGDVVFTPNFNIGRTSANYLGRKEETKQNKFAFGTSGVVFAAAEAGKTKSSAISFSVNQTADFKSHILYRGLNNSSSYSQKYLEEIKQNNLRDDSLVANFYPFGTSLAYNTYLLDTVAGGSKGNYNFQSRAKNVLATGLLQQNTVVSSGGIHEFALGIGANLNNKWMVGGTIGVPVLNYEQDAEFLETDATRNKTNRFDYALYKNMYSTKGVGFNLKGGVIYKPVEYWRLGFAFHTPTIYSLTDKYESEITADVELPDGKVWSDYSKDYTNNQPAEFKYLHITPLKLMASASYVLREIEDVTRQKGFLTADVEYVAHSMSSFFTDDENGANDADTKAYLKSLNNAIGNAYKGTFNFRAGGELKFTTVMVRGGFAYYGNPYKNLHAEKGSRMNISGGLGYRNKGFFIDASYVHAITNDVHVAYRLQNAAFFNADIKNTSGKIYLTLGFKI